MTWNHRIVKRTWYPGTKKEEVQYGIHEAYADKNGLVFAITNESIGPIGETIAELKQSMEWMQKAFDKPILDYDNIPEEGADDPLHYRDHEE